MTTIVHNVEPFDVWTPYYAGATVEVLKGGTTERAALYYDAALTEPADNPQVLDTLTVDDILYGKFERPVYTTGPYYMSINNGEATGVRQPTLSSLEGQDGTHLLVTSTRGTNARTLGDITDQVIFALSHGRLGDSPSENTATINAAIGAAAGQGGGRVLLSAGSYEITTLSLPSNVRLIGSGRTATTIQSQEDEAVITLTDGAGLEDLTLDGLNLNAGSIGIYGEGISDSVFRDVLVQRFDVGVRFKGADRGRWQDFDVVNCATGVDLLGEDAQISDIDWRGGSIQENTTAGIRYEFIDQIVERVRLHSVLIKDNIADGVYIEGARFLTFDGCDWDGNTDAIEIADDSDTAYTTNKVTGVLIQNSRIDSGAVKFDGQCQDVRFERCNISGVTWTLSLPDNVIQLRDCIEDATTTTSGDGSKLMRWTTNDHGEIVGVTTDNTAITAFAYDLAPGEVVLLEAKVLARERNGTDWAVYYIAAGARRPGSTLAYDGQTANFTVGDILTGAVSGATARIIADSDSGATGTLTLQDIVGVFENNEALSDTSGGAATANGTLTAQNTALDGTGVTQQRTTAETDASWAATIDVNVGEIRIRVTGDATNTVEWRVEAHLTR